MSSSSKARLENQSLGINPLAKSKLDLDKNLSNSPRSLLKEKVGQQIASTVAGAETSQSRV